MGANQSFTGEFGVGSALPHTPFWEISITSTPGTRINAAAPAQTDDQTELAIFQSWSKTIRDSVPIPLNYTTTGDWYSITPGAEVHLAKYVVIDFDKGSTVATELSSREGSNNPLPQLSLVGCRTLEGARKLALSAHVNDVGIKAIDLGQFDAVCFSSGPNNDHLAIVLPRDMGIIQRVALQYHLEKFFDLRGIDI